MDFSECKKIPTKYQVRSMAILKAFRKALQRDEKSFTTANLWGLSRSLCKSFHRNLSILALMPSSHSSWLRTRAQPGWWHPSPHLEYSSFTRR